MLSSIDFGARLKLLREQAGLTQGELAEKALYSRSSVNRWERSHRSPSWDHVRILAEALGVSMSAFTEGDKKSLEKSPN